jgi:hypothetical protein
MEYSGAPFLWTQIGTPASNLYTGGSHVFATDAAGNIWMYNGMAFHWIEVGGPGKQFAVDGMGRLYGISTDGHYVQQYSGTPFHWTPIGGYGGTPLHWTVIGGSAAALATGASTHYAISG